MLEMHQRHGEHLPSTPYCRVDWGPNGTSQQLVSGLSKPLCRHDSPDSLDIDESSVENARLNVQQNSLQRDRINILHVCPDDPIFMPISADPNIS